MIEFHKNTEYTHKKSGRHEFKCKKGLWSVDAPSEEQALREAMHYFQQYFSDGEYS